MDGVLVDSRPVVERIWRAWAAKHGLDAAALLRVAHGRRSRETVQEQAPHLDWRREVAWIDQCELDDVDGITAIPGAAALLAALPAGAWAIYTSCGRDLARTRLRVAGLPAPRVLVTSDDVARGKPAPDGWLAAAEQLGVEPGACVVVEDAPPGIAAARAIGAAVLGVTTTYAAERLAGAAAIVANLTDIRPVLEEGRLTSLSTLSTIDYQLSTP